jgi:hypothetical protein
MGRSHPWLHQLQAGSLRDETRRSFVTDGAELLPALQSIGRCACGRRLARILVIG